MSDTCYLTVMFARKDLDKFNEVLKEEMWDGKFWDENHNEEGDDKISAVIYDANNGWCNQLQNLTSAGLTFSGQHSAGENYGPTAFSCYKGEFVDVNTDHEGTPIVSVYERGMVNQAEMTRVNQYYDILDKTTGKE